MCAISEKRTDRNAFDRGPSTIARAPVLGAIVSAIFWLAGCALASPGGATITIDADQRFQTMAGWEVTPRLWELDKANDRYDPSWLAHSDQIFDALVYDVGVNRVRIGVRSGMENPVDYWARFVRGEIGYQEFRARYYHTVNDNGDPLDTNRDGFQFSQLDYEMENVVLPMQRRLAARGERLYVNLCFVDFRNGEAGNLEHALVAEEYAELVLAAFLHLQERYDLTPDAFEVILEPENTLHWRGERVGRGLRSVAARLSQHGFEPEFIAPSTTHAQNAPEYIDAMMRVPGVAEVVSTYSYHNYDNPPDSVREEIWLRAEGAGVATAMLEHFPSDAAELYRDLTVANASAWQQFGIAHVDTPERDEQGAYLLLVDPSRRPGHQVRMAHRTGGLAQFFRSVRAGAVRIGALSDSARKKPAAFVNPDGRFVVVVVAEDGGPVVFQGLPEGAYEVSFAPDRGAPRILGIVNVSSGGALEQRIPSRGVLAIRQQEAER